MLTTMMTVLINLKIVWKGKGDETFSGKGTSCVDSVLGGGCIHLEKALLVAREHSSSEIWNAKELDSRV